MDKEQARKKIEEFLSLRGYTYTVESLISIYLEYYKEGWYISYTAKDCMKHLESALETITA